MVIIFPPILSSKAIDEMTHSIKEEMKETKEFFKNTKGCFRPEFEKLKKDIKDKLRKNKL